MWLARTKPVLSFEGILVEFLNKNHHYIFVGSNFWRTPFLEDVQPSIFIWRILKESLFEVGSWPESDDSRPKEDGFA